MLLRLAGLALTFAVALTATARADERYTVDGRDRFGVTGASAQSEITYHGTGRLTVTRSADALRLFTTLRYERVANGASTHLEAAYETVIGAAGTQRDGVDRDPDDLTILNQPFAVVLDAATLRDLRALRGAMPFDFPSPMTGGTLRGSLRRLPDAVLHGERVLGVAFSAAGPLRGALPDHGTVAMAGSITMSGRAYYAYAGALLVGLEETLALRGELGDAGSRGPLTVVYWRSIRPL